jgi:hypothetical protein
VKSQDQIDAWRQDANEDDNEGLEIISEAPEICNQPLEQLEKQLDGAVETVKTALDYAKAAAGRADLPAKQALDLENLFVAADEASADLLAGVEQDQPAETALAALGPAIVTIAGSVLDAETVAALLDLAVDIGAAVGLAVAVDAAAAALASGACYAAYYSDATLDFAKAEALNALANDPPDPNFTVIATPVVSTLSVQPLTGTSTGLSPQVVSDLNALLSNLEQQIALLRVIPTTINRVSGAVAAGNSTWQINQAHAAQQYASQLIPLINSATTLRSTLAADLQTSGVNFAFSPNDILQTQSLLKQNGFPAAVSSSLTQLGLSPAAQSAILASVLATSPAAVGTLGSGVFPQALIDPSLLESANTTISAFATLAAVPPSTSLTQSLNITIPGDYTASGIGLRGQTTGNIKISTIPAEATVVKALLYWGMLDDGEDSTINKMVFSGTPVVGTRVGSGPDTCWGRTNSFSYRADVTPYVSGNATYALTGVASGGNILAEGASLLVIYQLPGAQTKTVMLSDGNVSISSNGVSKATTTFSGFSASAPVSATTTFMVGDGQASQFGVTPVSFTGSLGTISLPGLFSSNDGLYWDTDVENVTAAVGASSSSDSTTITLAGDCLLWSAQAFSVTTSPITSSPVTATAAVVQANANGNTVVNGRGLAVSDAPTLQQQVQMIVQSRIIQDPSISAIQLVTQLVENFPSSILSPSQAADIINTVSSSVVLPSSPATPANIVVTRGLTRSNSNLVVQVTLTNSGGTAASNVVVSNVKVGSSFATPLPQTVGTIAAGSSAQVSVTLPGSIGASGAISSLAVSGTYAGGTFTGSSRITLP